MSGFRDLLNMSAAEYKMYHESLMQDNHGSSALHTFFCIFSTVQCAILSCITPKKSKIFQYIYEYLVLVLPLIIIHTSIPDYMYLFNYIMFIVLLYTFICQFNKINNAFVLQNKFKNNRVQSITCMRALTYLITVFSILAVDFNDFPRYLAKTEAYGYSFMDTGVGLFVLMSGLVHKDICEDNYPGIIKGNVKFFFILTVLGIVRFISVKKLDYQEHITEYGVHWNFFFTLAVCKMLSTVILFCFNHALFLSMFTLILHELLLFNGLQEWVFTLTPRNSLLSANKEGISSCLGYVSMYLFAAYLKKVICDKTVRRFKIQATLVIGSIFLWVLTYTANVYRPASRTLANAGYCIYLESILMTVLMVLYFFEVLFQDKLHFELPFILTNINRNGLLYFLAANVLTGATNLTMRTFSVSSSVTFVILNLYMIATLAFTVYLKKLGIKI